MFEGKVAGSANFQFERSGARWEAEIPSLGVGTAAEESEKTLQSITQVGSIPAASTTVRKGGNGNLKIKQVAKQQLIKRRST